MLWGVCLLDLLIGGFWGLLVWLLLWLDWWCVVDCFVGGCVVGFAVICGLCWFVLICGLFTVRVGWFYLLIGLRLSVLVVVCDDLDCLIVLFAIT